MDAANEKPCLDHFTNLHDSVLSHILSRLPIKDVVRTSILSKDWKHKWTLSYIVDTDLDSWDKSCVCTFDQFLDEMLISRQHLKSFRATFFNGMKNTVQRWIDGAMRHNFEVLDVNLNKNCITFPVSLLNSTSLRGLKVVQRQDYEVKINVAEKNYAPKLTSLSLYYVVFVNQNRNLSRVSLEFPVLEKLEFIGTTFGCWKWMNVKSAEIYAPSLTSFSFKQARSEVCNYSIKIVAPKLSRFSCFDGLPRNLILDGSSIVSACFFGRYAIQEIETIGIRATDLLNGFTNLEELTLSCSMNAVLRNRSPLHCHDKLRRLTLQGSSVEQLLKWLYAVPSLEFLSLTVDYWLDYDYEALEIVRSCVVLHLEEFVLHLEDGHHLIFLNGEPLYTLAKFILKAAKGLKKFTITGDHVIFCEHLKKVLLTFYHCSPSLEICSCLPDTEQ